MSRSKFEFPTVHFTCSMCLGGCHYDSATRRPEQSSRSVYQKFFRLQWLGKMRKSAVTLWISQDLISIHCNWPAECSIFVTQFGPQSLAWQASTWSHSARSLACDFSNLSGTSAVSLSCLSTHGAPQTCTEQSSSNGKSSIELLRSLHNVRASHSTNNILFLFSLAGVIALRSTSLMALCASSLGFPNDFDLIQ